MNKLNKVYSDFDEKFVKSVILYSNVDEDNLSLYVDEDYTVKAAYEDVKELFFKNMLVVCMNGTIYVRPTLFEEHDETCIVGYAFDNSVFEFVVEKMPNVAGTYKNNTLEVNNAQVEDTTLVVE